MYAPPIVHEVLRSRGQPPPSSVRTFFEPRFGADFSQVRVHADAAAQQSARDMNANAYTAGQNIVFGTGRFAPETQEGRRLLAHELTHVVQQSAQGSARIDPSPQGIVQRQTCTDILNAEEVPGVTRGVEVEAAVRADLINQLGGQNIVQGLSIPGASSRLTRMEECGGFQTTRPPGKGYPDLAFRQYPRGRTVELAEVKIGTWPCLYLAERQVDNYVQLADDNEDYKRDLGVDHFEVMPTSRFTPTQLRDPVSGTPIDVAWCSPGVIVYKAVASEGKEQDDEPKDKEPGPSESLPEQLLKLGGELLPILAAVGLLDIGLAIAGVIGSFVSSPLVALAAVVLGIAFFWDELKSLANKVAGVAQFVWDKIAALAELVWDTYTWILGQLYKLGIKLAELGIFLAGKIASLAQKLAEGLEWIAGRIAAGGKWLGHKIASAAEAIWDWLWGSDVEPTVPIIEMPVIEEPTQHCETVAHEDTIVRLDADLLFPFNEWELKRDGPLKEAAAKIAPMLQKDDRIIIEGYTDVIGSDEFNQHLSEQRAGAVASWFVEHGVVPMSSIHVEGYGKTRAQAKYSDEEGRKKDRRVDIWVPKHGSEQKVCW
jgi:outer membrane protein OmpA-like peptidoglycan-associated protein